MNASLLRLITATSTALLFPCATISSAAEDNSKSGTPFVYDYDQTHALQASQRIWITTEDAEVTISGSDRNDVRIQAHYAITSSLKMLQKFTYRLNVSGQGPELRVEEMRKTGVRNFVYDKQAHTIKIEVPRSAHVRIDEEDGSCVVTMMAGSVDVKMDDGRVDATNCSGAITVALDNGKFTHRDCTGPVTMQRR